jgi:hypothetical protein
VAGRAAAAGIGTGGGAGARTSAALGSGARRRRAGAASWIAAAPAPIPPQSPLPDAAPGPLLAATTPRLDRRRAVAHPGRAPPLPRPMKYCRS